MCKILRTSCAALLLFYFNTSQAQADSFHVSTEETRLVKALDQIQNARPDIALNELETLIDERPTFKLAQVIYADLLLAQTSSIESFAHNANTKKKQRDELLAEATVRWQHYQDHRPEDDTLPANLIQMSKQQRHAVIVDLKKSRLYLYENKGEMPPKLIADYYVSMGKNGPIKVKEGDKRTPIGVYFITEFLPPSKLPDFYGAGAFPIDYPNHWDRRQKKTGYGIWLHGTPLDTYSRPPRASDGCVTLSNPDLERIKPLLDIGDTPVIISNDLTWKDAHEVETEKEQLNLALEQWRSAWESLNVDSYLDFYSEEFQSKGKKIKKWSTQKRRVNQAKSFIRVGLDKVSIFSYPGQENMAIIKFEQTYESNNYNNNSVKQQYWQQEQDGKWRIIYEGSA